MVSTLKIIWLESSSSLEHLACYAALLTCHSDYSLVILVWAGMTPVASKMDTRLRGYDKPCC